MRKYWGWGVDPLPAAQQLALDRQVSRMVSTLQMVLDVDLQTPRYQPPPAAATVTLRAPRFRFPEASPLRSVCLKNYLIRLFSNSIH